MLAVDHRRACGYLSGLDGDARLAVLHLLGCPACRETLEREVGAQVREQLHGTLAGPAPAARSSSLALGAASETMADREPSRLRQLSTSSTLCRSSNGARSVRA